MVEINTLEAETGRAQLIEARSAFLDAFSNIEAAIYGMLRYAGKPCNGANLADKLKDFRSLEPSPKIAKANLDNLAKLADQIAELLSLRADIVHSSMKMVVVECVTHAIFVNSQNRHERYPPCRLLPFSELDRLASELSKMAETIANLHRVTPPSSPPPPSPGAAGGP